MSAITPEGEVGWGIQLPIQAQSTRFAREWEHEAGPEDLAVVARAADRSGATYVAVCDHLAVPKPQDEVMGTVWFHTVTTLGWLAALTERVRLLSHVSIPHYRHPLETAKAFATLDWLSGGRAILGVGGGHVEGEFDLLGVDFHKRGKLLDEAIDLIRATFADEYPTAGGPTWTLDGSVGVAPRPVQESLPIWVGGSSDAAIRRAARRGDGWLPEGTPPSELGAAVELLLAEREAAGRDPAVDVGGNTAVYVGRPDWETGPAVSGGAEQIAEILRMWTGQGVNQLQVMFPSRSRAELVDQLERFGTEVAPFLRR